MKGARRKIIKTNDPVGRDATTQTKATQRIPKPGSETPDPLRPEPEDPMEPKAPEISPESTRPAPGDPSTATANGN